MYINTLFSLIFILDVWYEHLPYLYSWISFFAVLALLSKYENLILTHPFILLTYLLPLLS